MKVVTSYPNPDLDGVSAATAYAELLRAQGENAVAAFTGTPFVEAEWVLKTFALSRPESLDRYIIGDPDTILVDTSGDVELDPRIRRERVIEVIDHRANTDPDHTFPNAKIQIELVGAAATLVAERLQKTGLEPSREAAILLIGGIYSNTMNFISLNTTPRDHAMRDWLEPVARVPNTFVHDMFRAKTEMILANLESAIRADGLIARVGDTPVTQGQLELIGVDRLIQEHWDELRRIIQTMQREGGARYALLNLIDLESKTTDILVFDAMSQAFYSRALGQRFENNRAYIKGIFLRKQMLPLIKQAIDQTMNSELRTTN